MKNFDHIKNVNGCNFGFLDVAIYNSKMLVIGFKLQVYKEVDDVYQLFMEQETLFN